MISFKIVWFPNTRHPSTLNSLITLSPKSTRSLNLYFNLIPIIKLRITFSIRSSGFNHLKKYLLIQSNIQNNTIAFDTILPNIYTTFFQECVHVISFFQFLPNTCHHFKISTSNQTTITFLHLQPRSKFTFRQTATVFLPLFPNLEL